LAKFLAKSIKSQIETSEKINSEKESLATTYKA